MDPNTKKHIASVFQEMLQKTGPDKISVARLVEECHISRSLFYYYFTDIFDVMVYHLETHLNQAVEDALRKETPEASLTLFLDRILEHQAEISRVLNSRYREQAEREMLRAAQKVARQLLEERFLKGPVTGEELKFLEKGASYLIFGFVIDHQSDPHPDTASFARHLVRFTIAQIQ